MLEIDSISAFFFFFKNGHNFYVQIISQKLEVRSSYLLYSLKNKSSRCHSEVLRNDTVSFWFCGYIDELRTELQAPVIISSF